MFDLRYRYLRAQRDFILIWIAAAQAFVDGLIHLRGYVLQLPEQLFFLYILLCLVKLLMHDKITVLIGLD